MTEEIFLPVFTNFTDGLVVDVSIPILLITILHYSRRVSLLLLSLATASAEMDGLLAHECVIKKTQSGQDFDISSHSKGFMQDFWTAMVMLQLLTESDNSQHCINTAPRRGDSIDNKPLHRY